MNSFMYSRHQDFKICRDRSRRGVFSPSYCDEMYERTYWASLGDYSKDFKTSDKVIVLSATVFSNKLLEFTL